MTSGAGRRLALVGWLMTGWSAVALASGPAEPTAARGQAETSDVLARARALIEAGQPAQAVEALLAGGPPTDPRRAELLGVAYYHANDPVHAIEWLARAVEELPDDSLEGREAVQVLGLSHYLAGHLSEAIPYLERTRAVAPGNTELDYALGMAYVQTRQGDKARATWARSFGVPEESAAAHLIAGQMLIRAELDEMAEVELKKAIALDPRIPRAHLLLGQTALFRGRLDEAEALLRREIEVSPGEAMAFYLLGDTLSRQLKWDEALAALQRSTWLNPYFSGPYVLMGKAFLEKRDLAAAEGMLRHAIRYDPNNKAAHYLLGQVLQQGGRADEAKAEFAAAQRLQETDQK